LWTAGVRPIASERAAAAPEEQIATASKLLDLRSAQKRKGAQLAPRPSPSSVNPHA
jgi:hypothetical protein